MNDNVEKQLRAHEVDGITHPAHHANNVTFMAHDVDQAKENGNEDCALVAVNH